MVWLSSIIINDHMSSKKWRPLISFIIFLILIVFGREWIFDQFLQAGYTDYGLKMTLGILINLIIVAVSYYGIKRYRLRQLSGLSKTAVEQPKYLLFPLYIVLLNVAFINEISQENIWMNLLLLSCYCLSIGWSEELSIRGFLQSYTIKYFADSKKQLILAVLGVALIFGVMHLLKFNKGIYGEVSQVIYATFIGFMFGMLLLVTKRLTPLIIVHALIDFAAKIDDIGKPLDQTSESYSLSSAVLITLLILPCFIYGWYLTKKLKWPTVVSINT